MILKEILENIVVKDELHAKWLNTLSYMENAGAKKISASEDKENVTLLILKHAAEEHRHAFYLKKQISKLDSSACLTYKSEELLTANHTRFYLQKLDIAASRYLRKTLLLKGSDLRFGAYLFVTYAIELRADELYPVYQDVLDAHRSKVNVKSIILEEEGHLEEMIHQLKGFSPDWEFHAEQIVDIEKGFYDQWLLALSNSLNLIPEQHL